MKNKILIFFLIVFLCIFLFYLNQNKDNVPKQFILIVVDGVNVSRYQELLSNNELPNFSKLIGAKGTSTQVVITGHKKTTTAPGNAEIHTGLTEDQTKITDNSCKKIIPEGQTIFEKLDKFNSNILIGSIYGKNTCYIPESLLSNAKKVIDWWQDFKTYKHNEYVSSICADSKDVALKSLEFINQNKDKSFYLFVYFGVPDCAGHKFGSPSIYYDDAIKNIDEGLGIILKNVESNKINPQILITGDHGWNNNSVGHSTVSEDTLNVVFVSNEEKMIDKISPKQCNVAPIVLNYFGLNTKFCE